MQRPRGCPRGSRGVTALTAALAALFQGLSRDLRCKVRNSSTGRSGVYSSSFSRLFFRSGDGLEPQTKATRSIWVWGFFAPSIIFGVIPAWRLLQGEDLPCGTILYPHGRDTPGRLSPAAASLWESFPAGMGLRIHPAGIGIRLDWREPGFQGRRGAAASRPRLPAEGG